jgi:acylphosphatase
MPTMRWIIRGKVQGVFYRATARDKALELGLTGWVRNLEDGSVEAMATGTEAQLDAFAAWCAQGPPRAVITAVDMTRMEETDFADFALTSLLRPHQANFRQISNDLESPTASLANPESP